MKIDLHVHTKEISQCGHMSAKETVQRYKNAGYDCIVITNHFNSDTAAHIEKTTGADFFEKYREAYLLAKEEGEKAGLTVLNGYEIRFEESYSDYLVYGMSDDIAKDYKNLFTLRSKEFSKIAFDNGFLFYQAHPFRNGMKVTTPGFLFGIEVKNGNPRHDSRNDIAEIWANKFGLHKIAGSDCHQQEDVGVTGIITDKAVYDIDSLVSVLRADDYTII